MTDDLLDNTSSPSAMSADRLPRALSRRAALGAFGTMVAAGVLASAVPAFAATATTGPRAAAPSLGGRVPFTAASVTQASTGTWTVSYSAPGVRSVHVYVGTSATAFAPRAYPGAGGTASVTFASTAVRPWVRLVPDRGAPLVVAARLLGLTGVLNARDIGGYRTADGRWVREGVVFRTAALTPKGDDLAILDALRISTDYDLRTPAEIAATPDVVPAGTRYLNLNVMGSTDTSGLTNVTSAAAAQQAMQQTEVSFVDAASAKTAYAALLNGIAADRGPSLYHCSAGKDRTGWATAVLLTLVGVPQQTVMADYLLSNTYYYDSASVQAELAAMPAAEADVYEHFLDVEASYLQAGLDRVAQEYGSMEAYVVRGLGVRWSTLQAIRTKLVGSAPTGW